VPVGGGYFGEYRAGGVSECGHGGEFGEQCCVLDNVAWVGDVCGCGGGTDDDESFVIDVESVDGEYGGSDLRKFD